MSKKVAFVTPRYGPEIMGGAETAVRQLAEHLRTSTDWEAEVHTTCALDSITWDDVLDPGPEEVNGVTVHRQHSHRAQPARVVSEAPAPAPPGPPPSTPQMVPSRR